MAKKQEYQHAGRITHDVYRAKPQPKKSFFERICEAIGCFVVFMIVLGIISAIFG